jgi:nicotinamide mononucleotide transporter
MMDLIELFGVVTGLWCVWLTVKEKVLSWPIGIVNILFFMVMFYQVKLYADLLLQVIFLVLSFYGWYYWVHPKPGKKTVPVTIMSFRYRAASVLSFAAGTAVMGYLLSTYTDASVPYWDSSTTVMSIIAQWLMSEKRLECWVLWITADVIDTGIYYYKGLYLTSGLYLVFLFLATAGLLQWRKSWRNSSRESSLASSCRSTPDISIS